MVRMSVCPPSTRSLNRCGIVFVTMILILTISNACVAQDDVVQLIAKTHRENLARIESYHVRVNFFRQSVEGDGTLGGDGTDRKFEGIVEQVRQGDRLLEWLSQRRERAKPIPEHMELDLNTSIVLNDEYYADYLSSARRSAVHRIDMFEHASPDTMSPKAAARYRNFKQKDFTTYGFGLGGGLLGDQLDIRQNEIRWDIVDVASANGETLYNLRRFMSDWPQEGQPELECLVDPDKGHAISVTIWRYRDGSVRQTQHIEMTRTRSGMFFPNSINVLRYPESSVPSLEMDDVLAGRFDEDARLLLAEEEERYDIELLSINETMTEDRFTWQALGAPDGTDVIRHDIEDNVTRYRISNGALVPLGR